jgi:hypothetical protein
VNILFTLYVDYNCCLEVIILPTVFPRVIHIIHIITTNYALKKYADLAKMDGTNTQCLISTAEIHYFRKPKRFVV